MDGISLIKIAFLCFTKVLELVHDSYRWKSLLIARFWITKQTSNLLHAPHKSRLVPEVLFKDASLICLTGEQQIANVGRI